MAKIDRFKRNIPRVFKPGINPNVSALLNAWAGGDDEIVTQLDNTKMQIFVKTAEGQYLNRLGANVGVERPAELGLLDEDYRELIPNLSLKPKQIKAAFVDLLDIFWGPLFSRTNITAGNFEPFNVSAGDEIKVKVNNGATQTGVVLADDIATAGAATSAELAVVLNRLTGVTAEVIEDTLNNQTTLNLRTNTPGSRGTLEILDTSTMISSTKLDLEKGKRLRINDIEQRTVVYQIRNREITIEIPAVIPTLRRTLKGSHHLHADETIEPAVPPDNGVWQGSFIYSPNTPYVVTGTQTTTQDTINAGDVLTKLTVVDASEFPEEPGFLIFDWGLNGQEQPVKYIGRPNDRTLLLDPSHVFTKDHPIGSDVNLLDPDLEAFSIRKNGDDLAFYLPSPSDARVVVQNLLAKLAAAGVIVNFVILLPEYKYIKTNPYTTD